MDNDVVSFGVWIRQLRRQYDLTQDELGARVGCSGAYIRKIEADERRPSIDIAERLATCLGITHEQRDLFLQSSRGEHHLLWQNQPVPANIAFAPERHHLDPITLTQLIGRDDVLADIQQQLLHASLQLLTLVGPPGVGKTRLAHALGQRVEASFTNGVCWVALASVQQPELMLTTITQALEPSLLLQSDVFVALTTYLRSRHLLLILDNMEQLSAAASVLSDLLRAAPKVKLLVTSQLPLHLAAEYVFPVAPLQIDFTDVSHAPAIQLFLQRAGAVNPAFQLTSTNAASVAELCRRLDGLPLAIELAAARCNIFSAHVLLERLDQRLVILRHEVRDADSRHHSLYAAIDWSYLLLHLSEQFLFCQLSVFTGACTLSAIEAICRSDDDRDVLVIERLTLLVEHSLLQRTQDIDNEPCFMMLECVRAYAKVRLAERENHSNMHRAHAEYYLRRALTDAPMWGQDHPVWLQRVDVDYANLRVALSWSFEEHEYSLAAAITTALTPYWIARGLFKEGRAWVERLLHSAVMAEEFTSEVLTAAGELAFHQSDYRQSRTWFTASLALNRQYKQYNRCAQALYRLGWIALRQADSSGAERAFREVVHLGQAHHDAHAIAAGLSGQGWIAREHGDYARAQALHEQSLSFYRTVGDRSSVAYALNTVGWISRERGEYARAQRLHEESLHLYRELQHSNGMAHALNNLGWVAGMQGEYTRAHTLLNESLVLRRQFADQRAVAWSLNDLGWVLREQQSYTHAQECYQEALIIYNTLGDQRGVANMHTNFGLIALAQQQYGQAQHYFRDSSAMYADLQDWRGMARCLEGMAFLAAVQHQFDQAAHILGVAEALRAHIDAPVPRQEQRWYDAMLATLVTEGGPTAATRRAQAHVMPLTSAITEILPAYAAPVTLPSTHQTDNQQATRPG